LILRNSKCMTWIAVGALATVAAACGDDKPATTPTPVVTLTAPGLASPADNAQADTLRPTLTVRNATADQTGTRVYEFQISDSSGFASSASNVPGFAATVSKGGVPEGTGGTTSFTVEQDLQPTTLFYWRARAVQGTSTGPWSQTARVKSKLMGFSRPGELYDPLIHGETVGERVGSTDFVPGKGIRLNSNLSYVKYLLPQTVANGEFSLEVEGLRANAPGDKAKVFGMQEGQDDYITNRYRVDIQYRGSAGFPPNSVQFRVLYGDDPCCRYEPDTDTRFRSVLLLDPSTTYYWKFTWGRENGEVRTVLKEGGIDGTNTLYNVGVRTPDGRYTPSPQYAYLGAPTGRSGNESASITGTIYRNVWLSSRARPASLGSALR
jgi:hypothetical protein